MTPTVHGRRARKEKNVLGPKECFSIVLQTLLRILPIPMQGRYKAKDIHSLAITMASQRQSVHSIEPLLSKGMSETNFWYHLSKMDIFDLEIMNRQLLTNPILKLLDRNKPYRFAIDETDDPYYGQECSENEEFVNGGPCKKSTTKFYRYITLELLLPQMKVTLSALPVRKGVKKEEYIRQMVEVIDGLGLSIEVLMLDRGFYSGEVFKLLMGRDIPFIMPVKRNSKKLKALLQGRRSRFRKYILNEHTDPLELDIAIRTCYQNGRYGKHGLINYGYVFSGMDWTPYKISTVYERRFGIESSYVIRNKVRAKTTTRSPAVRYYLFLVSMLMRNVWMMLRWKYFRKRQRGPPVVDEDRFRFDNFRLKVWEHAKKVLKLVFETPVIRPG